MLRVNDVCSAYEGKEVLHQVSLHLQPGKITVLVGPNGCGKSTLLKTMNGIVERTRGEIRISGKNIEAYRPGELAQQIAYLPQNRNVPDITVKRMVLHGRFPYLTYPRRYRRMDIKMAENAIRQMGMEAYADTNMQQLSGGMQQKVYIAMALAQDTPIIMMDEPTSFLDIVHQIQLMEIARELSGQGKTIMLVLHDLSMALRTADQVIVLKNGEVRGTGTPEEIFESRILEEVFGLVVKRVQTEDGWQYYF